MTDNEQENAKVEMTALEILTKIRELSSTGREKEAMDLKDRAAEAGFDFSKIDEWESNNPELSPIHVLNHAEIDEDQKFTI